MGVSSMSVPLGYLSGVHYILLIISPIEINLGYATDARLRGTTMALTKSNSINRRRFMAGTAATAALGAPSIVRAQAAALKIAVLLPRSGYLAQAGQSCHRGALVAPKVLGDFGFRVELVHVDIESNPDVSRTQAEKVINEGAHCIVGAFDSGCTLLIAPVCGRAQ